MSTPLPSKTDAPPNNYGTATPSRRNAGDGELKDGQLSMDGRFRWVAGWHRWVPTGKETVIDQQEFPALGMGPLNPTNTHSSSCLCGACLTAGQRYSDYVKARKLRDEL